MRLTFLFILLASIGQVTAAELYKWTDAAGNVHYSDLPPPKEAASVERKARADGASTQQSLPFAIQDAARKHPVTLYTFDGCGDACNSGIALLSKRGIPYTLKNSAEDVAAVKKLTADNKMPVLVVGNQSPLKGYEENAWNQLLDLAGYPKSNPLNAPRQNPPAAKAADPAAPATPASGPP